MEDEGEESNYNLQHSLKIPTITASTRIKQVKITLKMKLND